LSAGHARALLGNPNAVDLARRVVAKGLSVRDAERLAKTASRPPSPPKATTKDADCVALERDLTTLLGLKVSIDVQGAGGRLTVQYQNLEQLDDLLQRLGRQT
jgi:ParB family chromosome partitioning protein